MQSTRIDFLLDRALESVNRLIATSPEAREICGGDSAQDHVNGQLGDEKRLKALLSIPKPPANTKSSAKARVKAVQEYISQLPYSYLPLGATTVYPINKKASIRSLMQTAVQITHEALPVKCLEAVIVALYLTAALTSVDRIPLAFKSMAADGQTYRHIVLAVRLDDMWGSIGISRKRDLMNKDVEFEVPLSAPAHATSRCKH